MNDYLIPVTNACTLVALSYVALKLRNRVMGGTNEMIFVPFFTGLASILMMLLPMPTELIIKDLRYIPIIMAGLRFGWPIALLSVIPPAAYSIWVNPPYLAFELLHGLLLPALISSFVHQKEYRNGYSPIRLTEGVKIGLLLFTVRYAAAYFTVTDLWLDLLLENVFMFTVTVAILTFLIAMMNEENKNWLRERELELEANRDRLTKLPNFRSFVEIAESTLRKRRISIMMIDIDNFKNYNDTLGHLQGDLLLREVGQTLRHAIGERDYIARYGGEEFIIMCHSTDANLLAYLAHRLCEAVSTQPFAGKEVQPGQSISISIGIAVARKPGDDLYRLISEADKALYDSKHGGKNRYTFYEGHDAMALDS